MRFWVLVLLFLLLAVTALLGMGDGDGGVTLLAGLGCTGLALFLWLGD